MSNRTVMVAVDGSADSDRAFRFAAARTQPNDRLHVVNGAPDLVAFGKFLLISYCSIPQLICFRVRGNWHN